jgi:hypothetical protein
MLAAMARLRIKSLQHDYSAFPEPLDEEAVALVDHLADRAEAAPPPDQERLLEAIIMVMLTAGLLGHRRVIVSLCASRNTDLLLQKALTLGFDPKRGVKLDQFARSHMVDVALDDGAAAVEMVAKLRRTA